MYATNDNAQALESRCRIRDTLIALMKGYPFQDITVTQICQEALVVRQTYYRNFDCKADILEFHLDTMFRIYFIEYYKACDVHAQLKLFFEYMLLNREFLVLVAENNLFFMIDKTIHRNIMKFLSFQQLITIDEPEFEKYVTGFIASTICSLLSLWVNNEFVEPPETMSGLAQRFLMGLDG